MGVIEATMLDPARTATAQASRPPPTVKELDEMAEEAKQTALNHHRSGRKVEAIEFFQKHRELEERRDLLAAEIKASKEAAAKALNEERERIKAEEKRQAEAEAKRIAEEKLKEAQAER